MRLVTLNLRHGGKRHMAAILDGLLSHRADVLVLTEYHGNASGGVLRETLAGAGLAHQAASSAPPGRNGILVAARQPFRRAGHKLLRFDRERLLQVRFERFSLLGLHMPNLHAKAPHWDALLRLAETASRTPRIFAGDFNTGRIPEDGEGFRFTFAEHMESLENMGWVDAWRHLNPDGREYTWYSHKRRGFRLDHAFLSPQVKPLLRHAAFAHDYRERGYSDHSALIIDVAL